VLLSSLSTGCGASSSAETGIESPFESQSPNPHVHPLCRDARAIEVSAGETTPLQFSAADVIDFVAGAHAETLHWVAASDAAEPLDQRITIAVDSVGRSRFMDAMDKPLYHGATCISWLEIDVEVSLRSSDGAVDERFLGTAYAVDGRIARISALASGAAVAQSLTERARSRAADGAEPAGYRLELRFSRHGVSGALHASLPSEATDDVHTPIGEVLLAYLGPVACDLFDAAIALDEGEVGVTGQALLDRFAALSPLQIEWSDGTRSELAASFTATHAGACLSTRPDAAAVRVPGTLVLQTADGRLDASYPAALVAGQGEAVAAGFVWVQLDDNMILALGTPGELGFPEQSGEGFEDFALEFSFRIDAEDVLDASIVLIGYALNDCTDEIALGEQCGRYTPVELYSGTLAR